MRLSRLMFGLSIADTTGIIFTTSNSKNHQLVSEIMIKRNVTIAIVVLLYIFTVVSCKTKTKQLAITINNTVITDAVSSGSGLTYFQNTAYLVGDDASYIAVLPNADTSAYVRIPLQDDASFERIAKPIKHDLEAAIIGTIRNETFLFAFGSGSLTPYRDTLYAINLKSKSVSLYCSLLPLYNAIKLKAGLNSHELNIEGATLVDEKLYLFNRGKNIVITINWTDFIKYVQQPLSPVPNLHLQKISLPVINNYAVGISGACTLNKNEILFTASLEETHDNVADGTIKGSYIGVLRINKDEISLTALEQFKDGKGKTILDKLESIEIIKQQDNIINAVALADNDDGNSKLFYLDIVKNK